jgi:hypothetical protein
MHSMIPSVPKSVSNLVPKGWIPFLAASVWAAGFPSRKATDHLIKTVGPKERSGLSAFLSLPPSPEQVDPFRIPIEEREQLLDVLTDVCARVPCSHRYAQLQILTELWRSETAHSARYGLVPRPGAELYAA